jgi:hypothetical protein
VLILLVTLLLIPQYLFAGGSVSGTVTISFKGVTVNAAGFDVKFLDAANAVLLLETKTDSSGRFSSSLVPGTYKIRASGMITDKGQTLCAQDYFSEDQVGADSFDTGKVVMVSEGSTTAVEIALQGSETCAVICTEGNAFLDFSITDKDTGDGIPGISFEFRDAFNALLTEFVWYQTSDLGEYSLSAKWSCHSTLKVRLVDPTGTYMPQYLGTSQSDDFESGLPVLLASCADKEQPCLYQEVMLKVTPPQQLSQLLAEIANAGWPVNVQGSLSAPLEQAQKLLTDKNPNNDMAACGHLRGFTNQLKGKVDSGGLSQSAADELRAAAGAIASALRCPGI